MVFFQKPFIIPFFLPHQGCPVRCVYCNQHRSGGRRDEPLTPEAVGRGIDAGLSSPRLRPGARVEVAFYGGVFTSLPRDRQAGLLEAAGPYLRKNLVQGLRLSTRPDAVDADRIGFLRDRGVETIELGAQSFDDEVLRASGRGHSARDTREAAARIKAAGLRLGLQLLPGLPGETPASRGLTLAATLEIAPHEARIYPLVVIEGSALADLYHAGLFRPWDLDEAVTVCAGLLASLTAAGVNVIRVGLQTSPELEKSLAAGPHHPAFGELVKSEVFFLALRRALDGPAGDLGPVVMVAPGDLSQALGQRRRNVARLNRPGLEIKPKEGLERGFFEISGRTFSIYEA
ncbi:MAG: radical SAM protein [Pseudomonadota bacterium]